MMPARAMNPIIEVAVKKTPPIAVGRQDADQVRGIGAMMISGVMKRPEPAHHQDVDQDHDHAERDAHVAEHLVGDLPLAVPLHGIAGGVVGMVEEGSSMA